MGEEFDDFVLSTTATCFIGAIIAAGLLFILILTLSAVSFLKYEELIPSSVTMNFGSSSGCSFLKKLKKKFTYHSAKKSFDWRI